MCIHPNSQWETEAIVQPWLALLYFLRVPALPSEHLRSARNFLFNFIPYLPVTIQR